MTHSLYSQNLEMPILFYDKFDKDQMKRDIIKHLQENKSDVIEHCKEYSKKDMNKYYGNEIINFYQINPKTGNPSKVILRGSKEYFQSLIEVELPF